MLIWGLRSKVDWGDIEAAGEKGGCSVALFTFPHSCEDHSVTPVVLLLLLLWYRIQGGWQSRSHFLEGQEACTHDLRLLLYRALFQYMTATSDKTGEAALQAIHVCACVRDTPPPTHTHIHTYAHTHSHTQTNTVYRCFTTPWIRCLVCRLTSTPAGLG